MRKQTLIFHKKNLSLSWAMSGPLKSCCQSVHLKLFYIFAKRECIKWVLKCYSECIFKKTFHISGYSEKYCLKPKAENTLCCKFSNTN